MKHSRLLLIIFLFVVRGYDMQAQTLKVNLSPDKSKVNRSTSNGIATIFFESDIEDLRIINADDGQKEQINKINDNLWYINVDVNSDLKQDGVCYRHFLLKSTTAGEYDLTTDDILPNQVLYYNVFLPKIAIGEPLQINANFELCFRYSSTLPQHRLGKHSKNLKIYRNLRNNQYNQLYDVNSSNNIINNICSGDNITIVPEDDSYESISITITDSIMNSHMLECTIPKRRSSLYGYVKDRYTLMPVPHSKVILHLANHNELIDYIDSSQKKYGLTYKPNKSYFYGHMEYAEGNKTKGEYLTNANGYFGWKNCLYDYTYYIKVEAPKGYASIDFNKGVDIKPKDLVDSLVIYLQPCILRGVVTSGNSPLPNVEIECETLYGNLFTKTGANGTFEIIGLTSDNVKFRHNNYRELDILIESGSHADRNVTIQMQKRE